MMLGGKTKRRGRLAVAGFMLAAALTFGTTTAASAVNTYNGSRSCTGAKMPQLVMNSSGGTGYWAKLGTSNQVPFTFTSGVVVKYAPYQSTFWSVNSNNWFATPYVNCY